MPKSHRATITIEFDSAINADAEGFKDKLSAAIRNGLHSEGWDDRYAKVVDVQGESDPEPEESKSETKSGTGTNKPAGQQ